MTGSETALCNHCQIPTGPRAYEGQVRGEVFPFCCYGCYLAFKVGGGRGEEAEAAWLLIRLGAGAFLAMNIMLFSILLYTGALGPEDGGLVRGVHYLLWALATPVVAVLGGPFIREATRALSRGRVTAETLIALGAVAAYGYSVFAMLSGDGGVYFDTATMLLVLFTAGRYLEAIGRARAARTLGPLLEAEHGWAMVVQGDLEVRRPVSEIDVGDVVRVRPGEPIPVDGVVVEGRASVNEALLTGESRAVSKWPGAPALAGTLNQDGLLLIRTIHAGSTTRWARIGRFVRDALAKRTPLQRIADHFAAVFVILVLALAAGTVAYRLGQGALDQALLSGIAVLVVACPCALGLATPLATALGISRAARVGILVRDGSIFEGLARVRAVAFDKTGTLTAGSLRVVRIQTDGVPEEEVLRRAASLERGSEHPVAAGVVAEARRRGVPPLPVSECRARPGSGIVGVAGDERVAAGAADLFAGLGWPIPSPLTECAEGPGHSECTRVYVGWAGSVRGLMLLEDVARREAGDVMSSLRELGLIILLVSGDRPAAAGRLAEALRMDAWEGGISPEGKLAVLESWREQHGAIAMVGDGLNDGPALAEADVGLAVASATGLARETSDIALSSNDLVAVPWIFRLAIEVRRTIRFNLAWAFGYNMIALAAAAGGLLRPILAATLMVVSSLIVVANSLRIERFANLGEVTSATGSISRRERDWNRLAPALPTGPRS